MGSPVIIQPLALQLQLLCCCRMSNVDLRSIEKLKGGERILRLHGLVTSGTRRFPQPRRFFVKLVVRLPTGDSVFLASHKLLLNPIDRRFAASQSDEATMRQRIIQ